MHKIKDYQYSLFGIYMTCILTGIKGLISFLLIPRLLHIHTIKSHQSASQCYKDVTTLTSDLKEEFLFN